jgi:hypothetical protein
MRQPKPWFRKQTQSWSVQINGRRVSLGKDKDLAFEHFHRLMFQQANGEVPRHQSPTVHAVVQEYLHFVQGNRAATTYKK